MKKLAKLLLSLIALTALTGCELDLHGVHENKPQEQQTPSGNEGNEEGNNNNNNNNEGQTNQGENNNEGQGENQQGGNEGQGQEGQGESGSEGQGQEGQGGEQGGNEGQSGNEGQGEGGNEGQGGNEGGNEGQGGNEQGGGEQTVNTVSKTIADIASINNWQEQVVYESFALDSVVTISSSGVPTENQSRNTGKYYSSNESYRLYTNENSSLTVSVTSGHSLKSVTITYTPKNTDSKITGVTSGVAVEVIGSSKTFEVPYAKSGNVAITEITVQYTGEAGEPLQEPEGPTEWSAADLALFEEYVYGVTVPFKYIKNCKLAYDTEYYCLSYSGGTATMADVRAYAALFTDWNDLNDADDDNDFYFQKQVTLENGDVRYVQANIYTLDSNGYVVETEGAKGDFYLDIYDPYYYAWPASELAEVVEFFESTTSIPVMDSANLIQVDASYYQYGYLYIYVLDQTETDFNNYLAKFEADYTITDGTDEMEGYKIAVSKVNDLEIDLAYEDGVIYITVVAMWEE